VTHCISCRYYREHTPVGAVTDIYGDAANESGGACHKNAPETYRTDPSDVRAVWPNVVGSDYCGEWHPALTGKTQQHRKATT